MRKKARQLFFSLSDYAMHVACRRSQNVASDIPEKIREKKSKNHLVIKSSWKDFQFDQKANCKMLNIGDRPEMKFPSFCL